MSPDHRLPLVDISLGPGVGHQHARDLVFHRLPRHEPQAVLETGDSVVIESPEHGEGLESEQVVAAHTLGDEGRQLVGGWGKLQVDPRGGRHVEVHLFDLFHDLGLCHHRFRLGDILLSLRGAGFLARQVKVWSSQYAASLAGEAEGVGPGENADMAKLSAWLPEHRPAGASDGSDTALVHGDYRIDNMVMQGGEGGSDDYSVAAVLDWELSTLGDPLFDLAYTCMPYRMARVPGSPVTGLYAEEGARLSLTRFRRVFLSRYR